MRAAKVQASLRIRAVSPEPPLLAHKSSESRGTFRQKARTLAPLNGWACAVKICHDGMLEDTNSLDAAHLHLKFSGTLSKISCTFSVHSWPRRIGDSCVKTDWNCLFKIVVFSLFSVTRIFLDLSMSGEIPCESCLQIWSFMLLYGKKVKQCIF